MCEIKYKKMYRMRGTQVEMAEVYEIPGSDRCLVKGDDSTITHWVGGFYETPLAAIDRAVDDTEMRRRSLARDLEWLARVRANVVSGDYKFEAAA